MKKHILILICLFAGIATMFSATAQSQFDNDLALMSPTANFSALAGYHGGLGANIFLSDHFFGFENSPISMGITLDYYFPSIKSGIGINYAYQYPSDFNHYSNFNAFYNKRLQINELTLLPSISIGMHQRIAKNINYDPHFWVADSMPSVTKPSFDLGFAAVYKGFFAAAQVNNINRPKFSYKVGADEMRSPIITQGLIAYSKSFNNWFVSPTLTLTHTYEFYKIYSLYSRSMLPETSISGEFGLNAGYQNFFLSASYNTKQFARFGGGIEILEQINIFYTCSYLTALVDSGRSAKHAIGLRWYPFNEQSEKHRLFPQIGIL